MTEFGGFPLSDEVDVVACETCQKPVLREAYTYHTSMYRFIDSQKTVRWHAILPMDERRLRS